MLTMQNNLWLTSEFGITKFNPNISHAVSNMLFESDRFGNELFETAFDTTHSQLVVGMHDRHIFISTKNDSGTAPAPTPLLDRIMSIIRNSLRIFIILCFISIIHKKIYLWILQRSILRMQINFALRISYGG